MADNRLFTDAELEEIGGRSVDAIQAAIDAGDLERAKGLSRRMQREFLAMHDLFRDWVTALLSFVGTRYGDEALYDALWDTCGAWVEPLARYYRKHDLRRQVQMLAAGLRGHLMPLRIEEDDEKFTFIMEPCGSGGRMVLEGKYEGPRAFLKVAKAQPMTFGREDFPVYCAHCAFQELVPEEVVGSPLFVTEPSRKLGEEPCRMYLYKDPAAARRQVPRA